MLKSTKKAWTDYQNVSFGHKPKRRARNRAYRSKTYRGLEVNGKFWAWNEWQEQGRDLPDLSYQSLEYGMCRSIPLQCPGVLRGNKPCKTKLCDGTPNFRTRQSHVKCPICQFRGIRVVGLKRE